MYDLTRPILKIFIIERFFEYDFFHADSNKIKIDTCSKDSNSPSDLRVSNLAVTVMEVLHDLICQ